MSVSKEKIDIALQKLLLYFILCISLANYSWELDVFKIVHFNDLMGKFDEVTSEGKFCFKDISTNKKCLGGIPRMANLIKADYSTSLLMCPGNLLFGSVWFTASKASITAKMMNALGLGVMGLGIFDFKESMHDLSEFLELLDATTVATNLDVSQHPRLEANIKKFYKTSITLKKVGKTRVLMVLACVPHDLPTSSNIAGLKVTDCVETINELYTEHAQTVDEFILLSQMGMEVDKEMAPRFKKMLLIIGGNTRTFLYNGDPPDIEKVEGPYPLKVHSPLDGGHYGVYIVQTPGLGKYIGALNIQYSWDDLSQISEVHTKGDAVLIRNEWVKDPVLEAILDSYRPDVIENLVAGKTFVSFDGDNGVCENNECTMGRLLTEAMIHYAVTEFEMGLHEEFWTTHPIAFVNGGMVKFSVRGSADDRFVTQHQVFKAIPSAEEFVTACTLTGTDFLEVLKTSALNYQQAGFLQFSGVKIVYDMKKPNQERFISAQIRCGHCLVPRYEDIVVGKSYNIISLEYLTQGNFKYGALKNCKSHTRIKGTLMDMVFWYMKAQSPLFIELDTNIVVTGETKIIREVVPKPKSEVNVSDDSDNSEAINISIDHKICIMYTTIIYYLFL